MWKMLLVCWSTETGRHSFIDFGLHEYTSPTHVEGKLKHERIPRKPWMMLPSKARSELGKYISSIFSEAKANCESQIWRRCWSRKHSAAAAKDINDIEESF